MSCHVLFCQVMSSPVLLVMPCHVMSSPVISWFFLSFYCHVMSCPVLSSHGFSCHSCNAMSSHVLSCQVMASPVLLVIPCQVMSSPVRSRRMGGLIKGSLERHCCLKGTAESEAQPLTSNKAPLLTKRSRLEGTAIWHARNHPSQTAEIPKN